MKKKKILKIVLIVITTILVLIGSLLLFGYFYFENAYNTENKPYKNYIGYIDQSKALLNDKYELCNEGSIYHTYSSASLKAYKGDKKQFKDAINSTFNKNEYTDSGYVNFRFLVNCEGNAGWFEIRLVDWSFIGFVSVGALYGIFSRRHCRNDCRLARLPSIQCVTTCLDCVLHWSNG